MSSASKQCVIVGISGGVDSAVAALLLLREGHTVQGLHMSNWDDDDQYCTAAEDYQDARKVCSDLDIPLHRVNFARAYREQVFADFLEQYRLGRTPNPDVACNRRIKFGAFLDYAMRLGGDRIATGHYVRIDRSGQTVKLLKGVDAGKDQSYFLHAVKADALSRSVFPLGTYTKSEVRRLANDYGFANHAKRDSTGICFIGERPFREFLGNYLPACPGRIETPDGDQIGVHDGLMYYTLGQRQGLKIGGRRGYDTAPWYVAGKDLVRNVLLVVQDREHPLLWSSGLVATQLHWIAGAAPAEDFECYLRTRYRQTEAACRAQVQADGAVAISFQEPQWAVTPGQYAVFYREEECLGGGAIDSSTAWADSSRATALSA